jgi:hypothetical protein
MWSLQKKTNFGIKIGLLGGILFVFLHMLRGTLVFYETLSKHIEY